MQSHGNLLVNKKQHRMLNILKPLFGKILHNRKSKISLLLLEMWLILQNDDYVVTDTQMNIDALALFTVPTEMVMIFRTYY